MNNNPQYNYRPQSGDDPQYTSFGFYNRMNVEPYVPGGYDVNPAPNIASQLMGLLNPLLGMLSQTLGIDKFALRTLFGDKLFSFAGDWSKPIDYSNIVFNRLDYKRTEELKNRAYAATDAWKNKFLQGLGFTEAEATEELSRVLSPYFIAAELAANESLGLRAMGFRFSAGRRALGGFARIGEEYLFRDIGVLGSEQLNRYAIYEGERANAERAAMLQRYDEIAGNLIRTYAEEGPAAWGGLKGKDVGQIFTFLAKDTAGFQGYDPSKITNEVKQMSKTIGNLKELFNKDIPALLRDMELTFGHNAAITYGAETLDKLVKQFKHTSRLAGITPEGLMEMAQVAEGYTATLGVNRSGGGFAAATIAAQLIGAPAIGASAEYVNQAKLKDLILKKTVGAQQSGLAMAISGAYAAYTAAGGKPEDFETMINEMGGNVSIDRLAEVFNLSRSTIINAARSDVARKYRETNATATVAATEAGIQRLRDVRAAQLKYRLSALGYSAQDIAKIDFSGTSEDIVRSAQQLGAEAGFVAEDVLNRVAQLGGYENRQTFDTFEAKQRQARILRTEAEARTIVSRKLEELNLTGAGGFAGIVTAIAAKETNLKRLGMAALGLKEESDVTRALIRSSESIQRAFTERRAKIKEEYQKSGVYNAEAEAELKSIEDFLAQALSEHYIPETGEKLSPENLRLMQLGLIDLAAEGKFEEITAIRRQFTKSGRQEAIQQELNSLNLKGTETSAGLDAALKLNALKRAGLREETINAILGESRDVSSTETQEKINKLMQSFSIEGDDAKKTKYNQMVQDYEMQKELMKGTTTENLLERVLLALLEFLKHTPAIHNQNN